MTKQEFLEGLRRALTGKISATDVEGHVKYYEGYITAQIRLGTSEEEVLQALGQPRLIAMSICAAEKAKEINGENGTSSNGNSFYGEYQEADGAPNGKDTSYHEGFGKERNGSHSEKGGGLLNFILSHPKISIAIVIVVVLLLLGVLLWLAIAFLSTFWPFILGVAVMIAAIRLVVYLWNRN